MFLAGPELNNWTEWQLGYDRCSRTCGGGQRRRSRRCLTGGPGSPGCIGPLTEFTVCNTIPCRKFELT